MSNMFFPEEMLLSYLTFRALNIKAIEQWKNVIPYNYAAITSNLMNMIAPLAIELLEGEEKNKMVEKCVDILIDIWRWMLSQGVISRGVLIPLSYYILQISDYIPEDKLDSLVKTILGLCRIAVPDIHKNDYEIATMCEPIVDLLHNAGWKLKKTELIDKAKEILDISIKAWEKYGFKDKAIELRKIFKSA